ncbi:MAG: hypothetical protein E5Y67_03295 [Mesorhizobium sp.]|uniref:hypothetical protein n=1 Tax=Mesorhizobium sp. TaxID=1871066 RepID=UPI00121746E1|nr:hypothetical protein [Mesorhizobium sp.]TIM16232.1 MAG: hypothetical protein E5Y67_03295 [Mesorhizobium sp.]
MTCKLNPCCGDPHRCKPPSQDEDIASFTIPELDLSKARYVPGFGQPGLLSDNADAKAGRQAEDAAGDIAPVQAPVAAKSRADTRCDYCKENGFQAPNLCEDCRSAIAPAAQAKTTRQVAWLIEREGYAGTAPHWYAENPEDGWHWWTVYASKAKHFASKAAAEAFPAYQMIATDPTISITEHVFLSRAELTTSQRVPAVAVTDSMVHAYKRSFGEYMDKSALGHITPPTPDVGFHATKYALGVALAPATQAVAGDMVPFGLDAESIEAFRFNSLKPEEIAGDARTQAKRIGELLHWFARLQRGSANPKWTRAHAMELAYYIATTDDRAPIDIAQIEKDAWLKGVKATHDERGMMLRLGMITKAEFDAALAGQVSLSASGGQG